MSAAEYQELGKRYYKHKEYQKAVDAFTEAIELMIIPTVAMLNNRAASFEKLQNFKMAAKDGRHMIKLDKGDARGYLRTADILQKMEKPDSAVEIYKHGLKNVLVSDENYKLLQGMLDKLIRQLSPPKSVDPFSVLPIEIVEMVIGYLTFRNMVTCLRVSKQWKQFLINRPRLWTDLDLSHARRNVSGSFVRHCVLRSQHKLKTATIHRFNHVDSLRSLATTCKALESLDFLSGTLGGESICEVTMCSTSLRRLILRDNTNISLDAVSQILRHTPNLTDAEFHNIESTGMRVDWKVDLPNLTTLVLTSGPASGSPYSINLNLQELFTRSPKLKHLTLTNWHKRPATDPDFTALESLESLKLQRYPLTTFPLLPPSLHLYEHIASDSNNHFTTSSPLTALNTQAALATYLPHLTALALCNLGALDPGFLDVLLLKAVNDETDIDFATTTSLTSLSLANTTVASKDALLRCLSNPRFSTLQELDLTDSLADDEVVDFVCATFPELRRVNLAKTRISGAGIRQLCVRLSGLEWIGADFCQSVSSVDAVELARGRGVEVSWRLVQVGKGKKGWRDRYL
ncbi:uncharacterized protein BDZ99DRAFT_445802 [Mytilinidion resinicola]|uniref:F-box domain-containing protein n=1 Tax=Mytilinidion resinicola TaxID=574789 RepID=A0A6A6YHS9_9PEZI|nr:uncharacterized protein BDZ99DRAFT_445802 [Mytilinidion resinicola]KAF2808382.1 hypothetical protein BDZ99DRAFT_445802 [Mytilinidion resinicola]